jgi:hypothetical protein
LSRAVVPTVAPQILRLIRETSFFEEPVSRQWAIPISAPYTSDSAPSFDLNFVSRVMGLITRGYADALVAGGFIMQEDANVFKDEVDKRDGIFGIYQTVCARKRSSG